MLGEKKKTAFQSVLRAVHPLIRAARQKNSLHAELVLNSCVVTCNVVKEIARIEYSPVAYGLCRSVVELVAATIYLAEYPESSDDFQNYGKWLHSELGRASNNGKPLLTNHDELGKYFQEKTKRGFPTWHGLTLEALVNSIDSRMLKVHTSSFLHGDSLMTILAMAQSPDGDFSPKLFTPLRVDARVPVVTSIQLYAGLLIEADRLLQLGCVAEVRELKANLKALAVNGK